jgi:DNA-binding transcriptional regulator YhcF (GntR family)
MGPGDESSPVTVRRPRAGPRRASADGLGARGAQRAPGAALFRVEAGTAIPLYRQIAERVIADLKAGRLAKGDRLPSINEACALAPLSRDTIVKAYAHLRRLRVLCAVHGKGYFLNRAGSELSIRTFVLLDTLNAFKEKLYAGLLDTVAGRAELDVWFHHYNAALFRRLAAEARGRYDRYVIMPFADPSIGGALGALEQDRLLLLDIDADFAGRRCASICQDFDRQLAQALSQGLERLRRYRAFTLVFPPGLHHPREIVGAFLRFGRRHGLAPAVLPRLTEATVRPGTAYLVIEDDDLVSLVKYCMATGRRLGKEVGVVSYNDTPLKEVVAGGITVVSIDFYGLGVRAGQHVLAPAEVREVQPTRLVLRGSL